MTEPLNPRDPKRWHDEVVLPLIAVNLVTALCVVFLVAALAVFVVGLTACATGPLTAPRTGWAVDSVITPPPPADGVRR